MFYTKDKEAVESIESAIISMAAETDIQKLETEFKNRWESSDKILKPSHPIMLKV